MCLTSGEGKESECELRSCLMGRYLTTQQNGGSTLWYINLHQHLLLFRSQSHILYSIHKWFTSCTYSIRLPHELICRKKMKTPD